MKIAFDLDGTLDRAALRDLCMALLAGPHHVYIITGTFLESGEWQDATAKMAKLEKLGVPFYIWGEMEEPTQGPDNAAALFVLEARPQNEPREDRLIDLGLRKGALCFRLGVQMIFDDSSTYVATIPKMSGDTLVLKVGAER